MGHGQSPGHRRGQRDDHGGDVARIGVLDDGAVRATDGVPHDVEGRGAEPVEIPRREHQLHGGVRRAELGHPRDRSGHVPQHHDLPDLCSDPVLERYVAAEFGSTDHLKLTVLSDYFKHGFDGSGDDGGSCIDGQRESRAS